MANQAALTHESLLSFQHAVEHGSESEKLRLATALRCVVECVSVLEDSFGFRTGGSFSSKSQKSLENQVSYQAKKRRHAEKTLQSELPQELGQRIASIWYLRVGLSDPKIAVHTLSQLLNEFPKKECAAWGV